MRKGERLCVGVLSGTSVDAAEAALCRIKGTGGDVSLQLLAHISLPFERALVERVLGAGTAAELCELNVELGEVFAQAVHAVLHKAGIAAEDVDVIGSHGQTVAHLPPGMVRHPGSLQLGEASVIAERTGIPVVSDFRTRDMAAGGHGAPLVPYLDWALFRAPGVHRALLNLGGIGNVSVVGERLEDTVAFDTGPGNMLLDALAPRASGGALGYDRDGAISSRGAVIPELLEELQRHPFLAQPPPKSGGREHFGQPLPDQLWARWSLRPFDLMATLAAFTAHATAQAIATWIAPRFPDVEALYVSGGGGRNPNIMSSLRALLSPLPVKPLDALGFPEAAKEAACFALLAHEFLGGAAQNVPSATGAAKAVVMGKMTP